MHGSEVYIAVDIEADGPIPGPYSMLSFGFAVVGRPELSYYTELKPISEGFVPEALAVSGLVRETLIRNAPDAPTAMNAAATWLDKIKGDSKVTMVGAPAVFDGMFLHWYFVKFIGRNPFGVNGAGVDLRSYWMGAEGLEWHATGRSTIQRALNITDVTHTHHALDDARELARTFEMALKARAQRRQP